MKDKLNSREHMLKTLNLEKADHIPCCFMSFAALRRRLNDDPYAVVRHELNMGLDSMLFIPAVPRSQRPDHPDLRGLPVRFHPEVRIKEWRGQNGLLYKEYVTPSGSLTASVDASTDWPHGDHIPFVDDYQIPRMRKPLIAGPADLKPLLHLLSPPAREEIAGFAQQAETAHEFAARHGVLLAGGWGVSMDMAFWLCGMDNLMIMTMEQPEFVADMLEMIHAWNMERMRVVLSAPVDLYIRRAWYEGCDFITPGFYQKAILPGLKTEAALAHEYGARFGYICSSGTRPMLDFYLEAGIDVLIGIDPLQGTHTDMGLLKKKLGKRICLWGGVSGALTVELGSEDQVRQAVRHAAEALGPDGFILSPVDNVTIDAPRTWENIELLIDEWRQLR